MLAIVVSCAGLGRVLDGGGAPVGTCFQVAPGVLVTAWHVLDDIGAAAENACVRVDPLAGGEAFDTTVARMDSLRDLAVLTCAADLPAVAGPLWATDQIPLRVKVTVTGHAVPDDPGHAYRFLDAPGEWAGGTTRDEAVPLGRMTSSAVVPGMSGGPVICDSEGAVAGVVSGRYNSADGWLAGTVWVARTEDLAVLLDGIAEVAVGHRSVAGPVAGWPLDEVRDPFALEVHRPVQPEDPQPGLPVLPVYVPRDHDAELGRVVRAAADGSSGIAVLVGGSSTGKTRACWEALGLLRDRPGPWRLWHPIDPSRSEAALRGLPAVGPRTVVWLNEAQLYLDGAGGGLGERVAAGLRELLRDPARAPVLVLATLWPEYWHGLTTRLAGGGDPHAQARELLDGHDITVPAAFTAAQLQQLDQAGDARLAQAAAHTPLDNPDRVAKLLGSLRAAGAQDQFTVLADRAAAHAPLDNPGAVAGLLAGLRAVGALDQVSVLADRAAAHAPLDNPCDVALLLNGLRAAGTPEQVTALADRAAAHASLQDPYGVSFLLDGLRAAGTPEQVTALLRRNPAACASVEIPDSVARLLVILREAGAQDQAVALADRAAAHAPLTDPYGVVSLLSRMRQVGALEQVTVLAGRAAAHASLKNPEGVARLLDGLRAFGAPEQVAALARRDPAARVSLSLGNPDAVAWLLRSLRAADAPEQATALADRLPGAGMFELFREQRDPQDQFRFGREADGSPAKPWDWGDLD